MIPMTPPMPASMVDSIRNCFMMAAAPGADRFADADLPGPLGHRDQHDVRYPQPPTDHDIAATARVNTVRC